MNILQQDLQLLQEVKNTLPIPSIDWKTLLNEAFLFPSGVDICDWIEENIYISDGERQGFTDLSVTAYLKDIYRAFTNKEVKYITIKKTAQSGGTLLMLSLIGYILSEVPGNIMYVAPTEDLAKDISKRFKAILDNSPALSKLKTSNRYDITNFTYKFKRCSVTFSWASSPSQMASKAIKYLILDEVDKYPSNASKNEADPISLALERIKTYYNAKVIYCSTPTVRSGNIEIKYQQSNQCVYECMCPKCEHYQVMEFDNVKYPKDAPKEPAVIETLDNCYYECSECKYQIQGRANKLKFVQSGRWVTTVPEIVNHVGFQISGLLSDFISLNKIFADFKICKDNKAELRGWKNSTLGEIWEEDVQSFNINNVEMSSGLERSTCSPDTAFIINGVDVQKDHYYYVSVAFEFNDRISIIDHGKVFSDEELDYVITGLQFPYEEGLVKSPIISVMDSAYDSGNTRLVQRLAYKYPNQIQLMRGSRHRADEKYKVFYYELDKVKGKVEKSSTSKERIDINEAYYKDIYFDYLKNGKLLVHSGENEELLKQMNSQHKVYETVVINRVPRQVATYKMKRAGDRDDHYLDCIKYAIAYADINKAFFDSLLYKQGKRELVEKVQKQEQKVKDVINNHSEMLEKLKVQRLLNGSPSSNSSSVFSALHNFKR